MHPLQAGLSLSLEQQEMEIPASLIPSPPTLMLAFFIRTALPWEFLSKIKKHTTLRAIRI